MKRCQDDLYGNDGKKGVHVVGVYPDDQCVVYLPTVG